MTPRGKSTMFRCPLPLRQWLEEEARRRDVSVSRLVVGLLEQAQRRSPSSSQVRASAFHADSAGPNPAGDTEEE